MSLRLMIVDDESYTREALRSAIPWHSYDIQAVDDAQDGLAALDKAIAQQPDIIICDIHMPRLDGLGLVRELHARMKDPPEVIILTAYDEKEHLLDALRSGVCEFLLKPAGQEQIIGAVLKVKERILRKREERLLLEQKSRLLEKDVLLFQSHYILAFLNRTCTEERFSEVMRILNVDLRGPYFAAALVSCRPESKWFLMQCLLAQLNEYHPVMADMDTEGHTVLLLSLPSSDPTPLAEVPEKHRASLEEHLTAPIVITDTADTVQALPGLWQRLLSLRAALPLNERRILLRCGDLQPAAGETAMREALNRLTECLLKPAAENKRQEAEQALNALLEQGISEEELVRFLQQLAQQLQQSGGIRFSTEGLTGLPLQRLKEEVLARIFRPAAAAPLRETMLKGHEGRALSYIRRHYAEDLSLEQVAQALYLSPAYLSRILNERTERGFIGWLRYFRIEQAKQLLQTDKQLKYYEIADRVGYKSYKVFYEHFINETGIPISQWKSENC